MRPIIPQSNSPVQAETKKIAIYLTNKCNLKCKHCFIEGSPENTNFLSQEQINTALQYFAKNNYSKVEFTGGEACISPFLIDSLLMAKKFNYDTGVSTNGTNTHLLEQISPSIVDKITFSLDGATAKTNDFLRGKSVFNLCINNIKKAINMGFYVEAIFTVHKLNYHEISKVIKLLDKIGVKRLSFNFINNRGTAILNQDLLLPPEKWVAARKIIEKASVNTKISLRYPILFVTQKEFVEIKKNTDYFCRLLEPVKTEIYPNGNIYHCCFVVGIDDITAGKVTDTKVTMNTAKEIAFARKYAHLSCPVHEVQKLFATESKLIPLCLYYKTITH
ncbi:MAG: radical SAM protein [Candidatus Shapirobacteria bacterium]